MPKKSPWNVRRWKKEPKYRIHDLVWLVQKFSSGAARRVVGPHMISRYTVGVDKDGMEVLAYETDTMRFDNNIFGQRFSSCYCEHEVFSSKSDAHDSIPVFNIDDMGGIVEARSAVLQHACSCKCMAKIKELLCRQALSGEDIDALNCLMSRHSPPDGARQAKLFRRLTGHQWSKQKGWSIREDGCMRDDDPWFAETFEGAPGSRGVTYHDQQPNTPRTGRWVRWYKPMSTVWHPKSGRGKSVIPVKERFESVIALMFDTGELVPMMLANGNRRMGLANLYPTRSLLARDFEFHPLLARPDTWRQAIGCKPPGKRIVKGTFNIHDGCDLGSCCARVSNIRDILVSCMLQKGLYDRQLRRLKAEIASHDCPTERGTKLARILGKLGIEWENK